MSENADTAATRRYEVILVTRSYRTIVVEATDPDEAKELAINVEGNDPGTAWESEGDFDVYEVSLIDGCQAQENES